MILEDGRACGVSYYQGNQLKEVRARREVISAGGAFGSPQLLLLSGIGAGEDLKKVGIAVVEELPGVGKNLQDHIDYVQSWRVPSKPAYDASAAHDLHCWGSRWGVQLWV